MKRVGRGQFAIYQQLVQEAGLYGQAFFGHKATPKQRKTLDKLHKRSIYMMKEERHAIAKLLGKDKAVADQSPADGGGSGA